MNRRARYLRALADEYGCALELLSGGHYRFRHLEHGWTAIASGTTGDQKERKALVATLRRRAREHALDRCPPVDDNLSRRKWPPTR